MPDVMRRGLLSVALLLWLNYPAALASAQTPTVTPGSPTRVAPVPGAAEIVIAHELQNRGDFAEAERVLRDVLAKDGLDKTQRDRAQAVLDDVIIAHRQMIELDSLQRSIDAGQKGEASKQLIVMLAKAKDPYVLARIKALLAVEEPWWRWPPLLTLGSWVLFVIPVAAIIVLCLLLRGVLFWFFQGRRSGWRLADVTDGTNRNAKGAIVHYFSQWAQPKPRSVTSGLLVMEASLMPVALPIDAGSNRYDIATSLSSSDLTVWGVSLGALARAFTALFKWAMPQPMEVFGTIYIDDNKRICARLTAPLPERNKNVYPSRAIAVSAVGAGQSEEALRRVSEEVTYKMLYALAKEGDVGAAEFANELRGGLEKLNSYLSAVAPKDEPSPWVRLEEARNIFEKVRKASPNMLEAHIFEGIALDLLERHDDAAAHFDHVKRVTETSPEKTLHEKAVYNGAVAHLRNLYALAPIDEAIERFNGLVRTGLNLAADAPLPPAAQSLESKPLLTLALATLADAWANRTVQWRKTPEVAQPPRLSGLIEIIAAHRVRVEAITGVVQTVLNTIAALKRTVAAADQGQVSAEDREKVEVWDSGTLRQVEWAKCNALGDFYLYAAVEANKLALEYPVIRDEPTFKTLDVKTLIKNALQELRKCEMLLPAGVETLSNIGTLYLVRGEDGDLPLARQYLRQAITLNPHYEYAYYRLAQSWEQEQWRERVVETLKSWPMPPQIGSFRRMFTKYFVQPKAEYPSNADSEDDT